jgi:hypothetical protein
MNTGTPGTSTTGAAPSIIVAHDPTEYKGAAGLSACLACKGLATLVPARWPAGTGVIWRPDLPWPSLVARLATSLVAGGRALHAKLKTGHEASKGSGDGARLVEEVLALSEQFGKQRPDDAPLKRLSREDLELICFEYVTE